MILCRQCHTVFEYIRRDGFFMQEVSSKMARMDHDVHEDLTNLGSNLNRLTCAPQYHSTSDAPWTLKIASCEAKLPQNTHLLRLSF